MATSQLRLNIEGRAPSGLHVMPAYISASECVEITDWIQRNVAWSAPRFQGEPSGKTLDQDGLPNWAIRLASKLVQAGIFTESPDYIHLKRYEPGMGIDPHVDLEEPFEDVIAGLTLGSSRVLELNHCEDKVRALLFSGDLYVLAGEARYQWEHGVPPLLVDEFGGERYERSPCISVTWRRLKPNFTDRAQSSAFSQSTEPGETDSDQPRGGPLPNFFIIGAARSGTTSLARYLAEHPEAFVAPQKEVRFFDLDSNYARGFDWYREQFRAAEGKRAIGDASPYYMFHPDAPKRMFSLVPDARLIAVLRNPADRAYSHYWHNRSWGWESGGFIERVWEEAASDEADSCYLSLGRYLTQLQRVCEFYSRDQLLVVLYEDLRDRPDAVLASICQFLEIDDDFRSSMTGATFNGTSKFRSRSLWWALQPARSRGGVLSDLVRRVDRVNVRHAPYPPMAPWMRRELLRWFEGPNQALAEWLGRDLSVWGS